LTSSRRSFGVGHEQGPDHRQRAHHGLGLPRAANDPPPDEGVLSRRLPPLGPAPVVEPWSATRRSSGLSDDWIRRTNGAIVPEDIAWSVQTWFPRARAGGWKHWAMVQPRKIIGQLNIARGLKAYSEQGINARMFSDPDEAMARVDAL